MEQAVALLLAALARSDASMGIDRAGLQEVALYKRRVAKRQARELAKKLGVSRLPGILYEGNAEHGYF